MEFRSPGAIFLSVGPLTVRWYGIMIALGFLVASIMLSRQAERWQLDRDRIINCALCAFIGGIVGARLYYVALSWNYFCNHINEIGATWNGGMSIHGGILGAALTAYIYCRTTKLPPLQTFDMIAAVTPLAQALGRWGNFFNCELFGRPVPPDFPLRLAVPPERRPPGFENYDYFHPAFLYESIWNLLLFFVLYKLCLPRLRGYPGLTLLIFLAGYSLGRMLIEPLRLDSIMVNGLQAPLVVSASWLLLSLLAIAAMLRHHKAKTNKG